MNGTFIPAVHAFRAFAILNVVFVHCFGFMLYYAEHEAPKIDVTIIKNLTQVLFHDSTIYFALISGILFSLILAPRGYLAFFKAKLFNVVSPYIFMTCLFAYFFWGKGGEFIVFDGSISAFFKAVLIHLTRGSASFTLWYIPVLLVLYLVTPLLAKLIALPNFKYLLFIIMLLPLIISRNWPEVVWENYVYFIGAYTVGLWVGTNYQKVVQFVELRMNWVALIALVTTLVLYGFYEWEVKTWRFISLRESVFYIQKLSLAALALVLFQKVPKKLPVWVDILARYAFPIYFMHGFLLDALYTALQALGLSIPNTAVAMLVSVLVTGVILLVCVVVTYVLQRVLARRSRHFIGA